MELNSVVVVGGTPTTEGGASGCLNILDNQCFAVVGVLANPDSSGRSEIAERIDGILVFETTLTLIKH